MSRATLLIKKMGGTIYNIYAENLSVDPDTGADIVEYTQYTSVLAWIQPTGSESNVKGVVLNDSLSGDSITAEFFMYHETDLEEHDRVLYKDVLYDVRAIEPWECSFFKYWKSYLVRVDGQAGVKDENN